MTPSEFYYASANDGLHERVPSKTLWDGNGLRFHWILWELGGNGTSGTGWDWFSFPFPCASLNDNTMPSHNCLLYEFQPTNLEDLLDSVSPKLQFDAPPKIACFVDSVQTFRGRCCMFRPQRLTV